MTQGYRGRFAPTPSGPLHFGSLIAAVGSYLEAKRHSGQWWLRIDDIDPPRVQPGAIDSILRCLERYGFGWDGPVIYQSQRRDAYHAVLLRLRQLGVIFPCACSRSEIFGVALNGTEGPVYPGTCRVGMQPGSRARALRLRVCDESLELEDEIQGIQRRALERDLGDVVLYRADTVFSFHLASTVDDAEFGMTHIVRGADLLESSIRQTYLQRLLDYRVPHYAHLPVAASAAGEKLSKQTHAQELSMTDPQLPLVRALQFLGQTPPEELVSYRVEDIWQWAIAHWRLQTVPRTTQRCADGISFASSARSSDNA